MITNLKFLCSSTTPGAIIDGDALADSGNDMVSSVSMIFFLCQKKNSDWTWM